ncbi:MAG: DNA primase, partial [Deferribacterales bacterium]
MENIRDIIVAKIDILEYISQYVDLKKSGKSYKGLCPFHTEKTPSFTVTPEKGLFHCFGCGASGNVITFVMKYNNLSFIDALKFLAARLGISMERDGELDKTALILKKLHNEIKDIAMSLILKDDKALNYIKDRGFDKDIIDSFSLGIIRSGFDFSYIVKRYGVDVIKESGLFLYKNGENIFKLADRLLFPIKDIYGDVIAFSGRSLGGEMPKYINSPETKIFKKGTILYNLSLAKDFIRDSRSCYIVEGYFDVIRMWSCGYKNVVSSMGTAFTKDQAALIKRYADNVVILYDGDQAGINAAYKT